jgi:hypothetical protein
MNWLRSVPSLLYIYTLVCRITESEGEPGIWGPSARQECNTKDEE